MGYSLKISFVISKPKNTTFTLFSLLLVTKDQKSQIEKNTFCLKNNIVFVLILLVGLYKILFPLGLEKTAIHSFQFYHFMMDQRSLNENSTFREFFFPLNLIMKYCIFVKLYFVVSEPKNTFISF